MKPWQQHCDLHPAWAKLGDLLLPANTRSLHFQKSSRQLSPRTIDGRLIFIRSFFSHLQRRTYMVNGKQHPKLHLTWVPHEEFRTPGTVLAACHPNPKDFAEATWFQPIPPAFPPPRYKFPP